MVLRYVVKRHVVKRHVGVRHVGCAMSGCAMWALWGCPVGVRSVGVPCRGAIARSEAMRCCAMSRHVLRHVAPCRAMLRHVDIAVLRHVVKRYVGGPGPIGRERGSRCWRGRGRRDSSTCAVLDHCVLDARRVARWQITWDPLGSLLIIERST